MPRQELPHRPTTTIVAARYDRGTGYTNWRPRGSGDWLLIYTETGAGRILAGAREIELGPGQAILYSPHAPQEYETHRLWRTWRLLWAHFAPRPHWVEWLRWNEVAPGVFHVNLSLSQVGDQFQKAMMRVTEPGVSVDFARAALEEALLWAREALPKGKGTFDWRVRRAMDYLAAHVTQPFRLAVVARACGLSVSRLSHLFVAQTGKTLQRYGEELKMDVARRLLSHTNLPIKEVAAESGFSDPFYFAKRFRATAGVTPTQYRRG